MSDAHGAIFSGEGLHIPSVKKVKEDSRLLQAVYCHGSVCGLVDHERLTNDELLALDVDLLIPAALENAITEANVDQVRASVILELANGPISSTADRTLVERGVTVISDVLANAGGVTVNYFEWVQNRAGLYWMAQQVRDRLRERMVSEAEHLWAFATERDIPLRTAVSRLSPSHLRSRANCATPLVHAEPLLRDLWPSIKPLPGTLMHGQPALHYPPSR